MTLYLVRHGDAIRTGGGIERDADRTLSARGEMDSVVMGRALARIDPGIDTIVTSPLIRAIQTGRIMGNELSDHPVFHVTERLAPGLNPRLLAEELIAVGSGKSVVAVGHQPDMSSFISFLVGGSRAVAVAMETCAVACITLNPPAGIHGQLTWLLTPAAARSIYPLL